MYDVLCSYEDIHVLCNISTWRHTCIMKYICMVVYRNWQYIYIIYYAISVYEDIHVLWDIRTWRKVHILCNRYTWKHADVLRYMQMETYVYYVIYLHEMYTYQEVYLHEYINVLCYIFARRYKWNYTCIMWYIYIKIYMYDVIYWHEETHV